MGFLLLEWRRWQNFGGGRSPQKSKLEKMKMKTVSVENMVLKTALGMCILIFKIISPPSKAAQKYSPRKQPPSAAGLSSSGYVFPHLHVQPSEHAATCRCFWSLQSFASASILFLIRSYVMEQSPAHTWQIKMCWAFPLISFFSCLQEMIRGKPAGYHLPLLNNSTLNYGLLPVFCIFCFHFYLDKTSSTYCPSFGENCHF